MNSEASKQGENDMIGRRSTIASESSSMSELPSKFSYSLSLTAKEFVPSQILSTTIDSKARGGSQTETKMMNFPQSSAFSSPGAATTNIPSTAEPFPLETIDVDGVPVDSAIVAALRDARERAALFRLENALVDFINECQSRNFNTADESYQEYMDVGGPSFSIILTGNSNTPTTAPTTAGSNAVLLRQSSFQRLVMHRLADRFGILRRQSPLSTANIPLMRLIRVSSSFIPNPLISDLDWSPFANPNGPNIYNNKSYVPNQSKNSYTPVQGYNSYVPIQAINISDHFAPNNNNYPIQPSNDNSLIQAKYSLRNQGSNSSVLMQTQNGCFTMQANSNISKELPVSAPTNYSVLPVPQDRTNQYEEEIPNESSSPQPGIDESRDTPTRPSNPKVVIMKRSVSSTSTKKHDSETNLAGMDESGGVSMNKLKGKKVSDREKAYLEARARILGESEVSDPSDSNVTQGLDGIVPSPSASGTETPKSQAGDGASPSPTPTPSETPSESDGINQGNDGLGLASKVLWRNRKQEECDPDFKRGVIPVVVIPPTTNVYSVPIRGGPISRMTPVASTTSATSYYPPAVLQTTAYAATPVDMGATSSIMRSTGAGTLYPPSQVIYFGSTGQVGSGNIPNPNRSHPRNTEGEVGASFPREIVVHNDASATDLSVPSLDNTMNVEIKKKESIPTVGDKTFVMTRRSGSSPWGMKEEISIGSTKESNQSLSGNTSIKDGKAKKFDEDFPALG